MTRSTSFDLTRRTGPLSEVERKALSSFLSAFPRPLLGGKVLSAAANDSSDLARGCFELQHRGWMRVRWPVWELTARAVRELPEVAGADVFTRLPAEVAAEAAAAREALEEITLPAHEQRLRMPTVLAVIGWSALNDDADRKDGTAGVHAALFARLLATLAAHGLTEDSGVQLRKALCNTPNVSMHALELATNACAAVPLPAFRSALGRAGSLLTRGDLRLH